MNLQLTYDYNRSVYVLWINGISQEFTQADINLLTTLTLPVTTQEYPSHQLRGAVGSDYNP